MPPAEWENGNLNDYLFETDPYEVQLEAFKRSRDSEAFGLLMEMGLGKSKILIDTCAYLRARGRIGAAIIFAPSGVHRNWVTREIPKHHPSWSPHVAAAWSSSARKADRRAMESLFEAGPDPFRYATVNYEALSVERARRWVRRVIETYGPVMIALDESHFAKNPSAKRTKALLRLRRLAAYRRILTGTAVLQGPPDLYSQFAFLDPGIFGHRSIVSFRAEYAEILDPSHPLVRHAQSRSRWPVQIVARDADGNPIWRNQAQLRRLMAPHAFVARKGDWLDRKSVV